MNSYDDDIELNALKYANLGEKLSQEGFKEKPHYIDSTYESPMYELKLFSDYRVIIDVGEESWQEGYQVHFGILSDRFGVMTATLLESSFGFQEYARIRRIDNPEGEITPYAGPLVEIIDGEVVLGSGGVDFSIPELGTLLRDIDTERKLFQTYYAANLNSKYNETKLYAFVGVSDGLWAYLYICCECNMNTSDILDYYHTPQMQAKVKSWFLEKDPDEQLIEEYRRLYLSICRK